mgnify:FL=1
MLKNIYLLLIFILGFFLTPSVTYACSKSSNNVAKECSIRELNKEKSHQKHIRDVKNNQCEKDHPCNSNNGSCNGKCGHSSCRCITFYSNYLFIPQYINTEYRSFSLENTQKFSYKKDYISSGFYFIWQPPKIS